MYLRIFVLATAMLITAISWAAGGIVQSPTGVAPDRYVYYPGTEALNKDEIRLISCGTGLPAARRDQAATCWLAEVGNGDKFFFDYAISFCDFFYSVNNFFEVFLGNPSFQIYSG